MKKIVVYLILFSFGLLLAPRAVLHTHENELVEQAFDQKGIHHSQFDSDCIVCELDLGIFTVPSLVFYKSYTAATYKQPKLQEELPLSISQIDFFLRGPPIKS